MKKKVILITLPANVRSIMPKSVLVPAMTITLNAMPNNGAKTTDIIRLLVLFLNMSTNNARTEKLIINNAKPTMTGLVKNLDTPKLVLPVRNFIKIPDVALMILLTAPVALLPDVRVIPLHLILLTVPTVLTDANIPVIIPAIWTARPARQPPTRAAAAAQPETAAETRPVIILMKPAVILIPAKQDVPAELIPALTVAAVPEPVVLPVHLLLIQIITPAEGELHAVALLKMEDVVIIKLFGLVL